ncbi:MAG: glycosyltransferase family 9 protein, partial [bacterium]
MIRLWAVAEILSATPLIRVLHQSFPGAKVDFLLEETFADLLAGCSCIENIIPWSSLGRRASCREILRMGKKIKRHHYDVVVDLQGEKETAFLSFLSRARYRIGYRLSGLRGMFYNMKAKILPIKKHLVLSYLDLIRNFVPSNHGPLDLKLLVAEGNGSPSGKLDWSGVEIEDGGKKKFFIYPGAERPSMVWPVERFAQLAYHLMHQGSTEVILAGADRGEDRAIVEKINQLLDNRGRVFFYSTLSQLISLMQAVDFFVGSDSGP